MAKLNPLVHEVIDLLGKRPDCNYINAAGDVIMVNPDGAFETPLTIDSKVMGKLLDLRFIASFTVDGVKRMYLVDRGIQAANQRATETVFKVGQVVELDTRKIGVPNRATGTVKHIAAKMARVEFPLRKGGTQEFWVDKSNLKQVSA